MNENIDKKVFTMSILLSVSAITASLAIDKQGSIVNILSTLALVGPTSIVVTIFIDRRSAKKAATSATFPISLLLANFFRGIHQSEGCISLLYRNDFMRGFNNPPARLSKLDCLDEMIKIVKAQQFRIRYAIENPNIEKSSSLRYSRGMLLYPDFNLALSIISSIDSRSSTAASLMSATIARNWYTEREIIFCHSFKNNESSDLNSILNHATGIPAAKTYAELNDGRDLSVLSVRSVNYLESVERSLIHIHSILTWLRSEVKLSDSDLRKIRYITNEFLNDGRFSSQVSQYSSI